MPSTCGGPSFGGLGLVLSWRCLEVWQRRDAIAHKLIKVDRLQVCLEEVANSWWGCFKDVHPQASWSKDSSKLKITMRNLQRANKSDLSARWWYFYTTESFDSWLLSARSIYRVYLFLWMKSGREAATGEERLTQDPQYVRKKRSKGRSK